jgi:hypothetical protein
MKRIKITENQAKLLGITKPSKKGTVIKITLEQYNRLIKEDNPKVKGGTGRVDKAFKVETKKVDIKNFTDRDIKSEEEDFDIKDPNKKIGGSRMKPTPTKREEPIIFESEDIENAPEEVEDPHPAEVAELLKYLYRKSDKLSPYWEQNGLSHDSIVDTLLSKGMLVKKNGTHQLSKSLGDPKTAIKTVEEELRKHIKPVVGENDDNYPAGARYDSRAPYNQKDEEYVEARDPRNPLFTPLYANREIIILDSKGSKFIFYHGNVNDEDYMNAEAISYPVDDKMNNIRPTKEDIANYVNLMVEDGQINVVSGPTNGETPYDIYESGVDAVIIIDDEVKEHLISLYDKDKNLISILSESNLKEEEGDDLKARLAKIKADSQKWEQEFFAKRDAENAINSKKALTKMRMTAKAERTPKAPDVEKKDPPAPDFFGTAWDEVSEMNTGNPGATGMFVGPIGFEDQDVVSRDINNPEVKVVKEMTAGMGSVGPYDANALPNIARNGDFKKGKKTEAEKTPQIKNGSFVKLNSCVKLNNNKSAQNGKCNQGDSGVVSYSKTAPSSLYEVIAKKTGKTIEEVKRIIESKNTKA